MNVRVAIRVLRERLLLIVLAGLVGAAGGLAAFLLRPAEYTSNLSLYVSAQIGDTPQQAYQGAQLSEQRVKSYTELVTSDRVLGETAQRLGISDTPSQLASRVTAVNALDSVIISVSVTDTSAVQAAQIANTVGTVVSDVVTELERPAAPNGVPPVAVRVVQQASIPAGPSSPGLPIMLVVGLIGGLAVGVGSAFARNALDTSIKSIEDLAEASGAPNLGVIAFDSAASKNALTVHDDPQSSRSESFRQLRTNLQFVDVDRPRKVILVTSSLPAEGKTTTVANLAIALAAAGGRILVIEADLRRPKLSALFGIDRSVGLTRVLTGRLRLSQAVQGWGGGSFDVLPCGPTPPNPSELLSSNQMTLLLEEARSLYDLVLIDSPPLLPVTDAAAFAPSTDGAVLVCRFKKTNRHQLQTAVNALRNVSVEPIGTIFTMVPERGPMAYARYNSYYKTDDVAASGDNGLDRTAAMPARPSRAGSPGGPPSQR